MARSKIRTSTRHRSAAKRPSLPASIANAVVAQLTTMVGSGQAARTAPASAKRRAGALSHPAARGKASGSRPSLSAAVASALVNRLTPAKTKRVVSRARTSRPTLAAAVARAVSQRLAGKPPRRRR